MGRMGKCAVRSNNGVSCRCLPCRRASEEGDDVEKLGDGDRVLRTGAGVTGSVWADSPQSEERHRSAAEETIPP
jgi:hypothetical protein